MTDDKLTGADGLMVDPSVTDYLMEQVAKFADEDYTEPADPEDLRYESQTNLLTVNGVKLYLPLLLVFLREIRDAGDRGITVRLRRIGATIEVERITDDRVLD